MNIPGKANVPGKLFQGSNDSVKSIEYERMRVDGRKLKLCAEESYIMDAHCHYLNYRQQTEGLEDLKKAMDKNNVAVSVLCGTPFKKSWVGLDQPAPQHHLHDDGDLYPFSMTDGFLIADMRRAQAASSRNGDHDFLHSFGVSVCGFNLGDVGVASEATRMLETYPALSIGEVTLQSDDINNMSIKGGNWTYAQPSVNELLRVCSERPFRRSRFPSSSTPMPAPSPPSRTARTLSTSTRWRRCWRSSPMSSAYG